MLKGKLKFNDSPPTPNIRYYVKNNPVTKARCDVDLQFTMISVCGQVHQSAGVARRDLHHQLVHRRPQPFPLLLQERALQGGGATQLNLISALANTKN